MWTIYLILKYNLLNKKRCNQKITTLKTGTAGIEPTPKVLETFVLPLNYVPKWWEEVDSNH